MLRLFFSIPLSFSLSFYLHRKAAFFDDRKSTGRRSVSGVSYRHVLRSLQQEQGEEREKEEKDTEEEEEEEEEEKAAMAHNKRIEELALQRMPF